MNRLKHQVTKKQASRFMAILLEPQTGLEDKELVRLEKRAAKENKRRREERFLREMNKVLSAEHLYRHLNQERLLSEKSDNGKSEKAFLAFVEAVRRMMKTPAPTITALRRKEGYKGVGRCEKEFEPLIAADKKRLGCK